MGVIISFITRSRRASRAAIHKPLNLQEGKDGKAKSYQVRQMIQMATEMGIITVE